MTRPRRTPGHRAKPSSWLRTLTPFRHRPNYWFRHSNLLYSKIAIRTVELLWLECYAPSATVTWREVPDRAKYPSYQTGQWSGWSHFVEFPPKDQFLALQFYFKWKSKKI